MSNPMAVTLDSFNTARSDFQKHYYLVNCNSAFGGQDIKIPWNAFESAVTSFINNNPGVNASSVALRFVYCYDASKVNSLYLRMQICTMVASAQPNVFDLDTTPSAWYEIKDGSILATPDTSLSDQTYFDDFYYCATGVCNAASVQKLADDTSIYARNITFPWANEVLALFIDNLSPVNASICFAACSFQAAQPIAYPHSLVIYLRDADGNPMLNNEPATGFQMKGADMGTICPVMCDVYVAVAAI